MHHTCDGREVHRLPHVVQLLFTVHRDQVRPDGLADGLGVVPVMHTFQPLELDWRLLLCTVTSTHTRNRMMHMVQFNCRSVRVVQLCATLAAGTVSCVLH